MNYKIISWIFVMIILVFSCGASGAIINIDSNTNLALNVIRQDPFPAEPGKMVDVWLRVTLRGTGINVKTDQIKTLEDVKIELVEEYPFAAYSKEDKTKSFSKLLPGDVITMKFKVRVDSDAPEGKNQIKFQFSSKDQTRWIKSAPIDIYVGNVEPVLSISKIESKPERLKPGEKGEIAVTLTNYAKTSIRDITLDLDLNSYFSPIGSTSKKRITNLNPGEEREIIFEILTLPDTMPNAYTIPIDISYYDVSSNYYTVTEHTGIIVNSDIDYLFNLESSSTFSPDTSGEIIVSVSNIGLGMMKFLTLSLENTDDYYVIGKKTEYMGNLESDDFETAEFKIFARSNNQKNTIPLKFTINYKDDFNREFSEQKEINLQVYDRNEIKKYGLLPDSTSKWTYLFYLLIILWIYFVIVEYKEKENFAKSLSGGVERILLMFFRILLFWTPRNMKRLWRRINLFFKKL